jgi:DNA-binding PadR family transcriptional regulator
LSKTALLILGIIDEVPVNPYEIVKIVNYKRSNLKNYMPQTTVYSTVKILERKGLITGERMKNGNMPEMTVYSITASGKDLLRKNLLSYLSTPENNLSGLVLSTILISSLDRETVLKALENYRVKVEEEITARKKFISSIDYEESYIRQITIENTLNVLQANLKTIDKLIKLAGDAALWSTHSEAPWWRNEYIQNKGSKQKQVR